MATFKRYRDSKGDLLWGVLLIGSEDSTAQPGKKINVTKRNGKAKTVTLDQPIAVGPVGGSHVWSIVGGAKAKRGKYVPLDGKCNDCGKAIPSKYTQCIACRDSEQHKQDARRMLDAAAIEHEQQPASDMSAAADGPFPAW